MSTLTLHYIYDPLCGWCYGAAPLVQAARQVDGLRIELHAGGMMAGSRRQPVTEGLRGYVMQHDRRIAAMTGQPFGDDYFDGLLKDNTAVFDSAPPTAAILAADALTGAGLDMLKRLQHVHYVEGRRIADRSVLRDVATELRLDPARFDEQFDLAEAALPGHFTDSRRLLVSVGGQGFPTLALEDEQGRFTTVDTGRYLGRPAQLAEELSKAVTHTRPASSGASSLVCGPDHCEIPD